MSNRVKPYQGESSTRLQDLINEKNNTDYLEKREFTFGEINEIEHPFFNTEVYLKSKRPDLYVSSTVRYQRLPLTVINELPSSELKPVAVPYFPITTHVLIEDINESLGLNLVKEEVVDLSYPTYAKQLPLRINESSYAWLPSLIYFNVLTESMVLTENEEPLLLETGFFFEVEAA